MLPPLRRQLKTLTKKNQALQDILKTCTAGTRLTNVEKVDSKIHNTKITILMPDGRERVHFYNRIDIANVIPEGFVYSPTIPETVTKLNILGLDFHESDFLLDGGKITLNPFSLGYYGEQVAVEVVHYIDRVNFFHTPRIGWDGPALMLISGFNVYIDGKLDYIQVPEPKDNYDDHIIGIRNTLAGYFETRMDLDFENTFDTTTNLFSPDNGSMTPLVTPSFTILNKTTREISISIDILHSNVEQGFPHLQKVVLAPMGTSISEVPSKRKTIVTDEVSNGEAANTLVYDGQAISKLKLNDGKWIELIPSTHEERPDEYVPMAIKALTGAGVNNQIRVLMSPSLENYTNKVSWRYMFENITSQCVKVAIEFNGGRVVDFVLGPDDQLAEPYMHRYLTTINADFGWKIYEGSHGLIDKSYLKLGADTNAELLSGYNADNVFNALINTHLSWSEDIDLNLWGDLTSLSMLNYVLIVINLTQKTLPFSIDSYFLENGIIEGNVSEHNPIWVCHPTVLGPAGVTGDKLDFTLTSNQRNGRATEIGIEDFPAAADILAMGIGMKPNGSTDVIWSTRNDGVRRTQLLQILDGLGARCITEYGWKPSDTLDDDMSMMLLMNNPFPQVDTLYQYREMGQAHVNLNLNEVSFVPKPSIFRAIILPPPLMANT